MNKPKNLNKENRSRSSKKIKKNHRKTHKKSNKNNNDEVRKTLWEKIEKGLDKKRMEFKIKKRLLTIELLISCMHMVIESIKEEHIKQDQLIEYFMEAFNQEIILNEQIIQSGSYTRSWEYVASAIIINTTDPIQFISEEELSKIPTVEIREYK